MPLMWTPPGADPIFAVPMFNGPMTREQYKARLAVRLEAAIAAASPEDVRELVTRASWEGIDLPMGDPEQLADAMMADLDPLASKLMGMLTVKWPVSPDQATQMDDPGMELRTLTALLMPRHASA